MNGPERIAIVSVNWLGDAVMSLPALYALRAQQPDARLVVVTKPKLEEFWSMCPVIDEILELRDGIGGMLQAAATLASGDFTSIYVLPNSFRSAWVAFLSGIRRRVGFPGHWRRLLLTRPVALPAGRPLHQAGEYYAMFGLPLPAHGPRALPATPLLTAPAEPAGRLIPAAAMPPFAGLLPGAARGPSKRWPLEYFGEIGRRLADRYRMTVLVLGSAPERGLCEGVAGMIGRRAINVAGRTGLKDLAALLAQCRLVVCNDSGGMHLAAAMGVPTVTVYGTTDPNRTGPLGTGHRVVQDRQARRSRDIGRTSAEAERHLRNITPDRVWLAVEQVLRA